MGFLPLLVSEAPHHKLLLFTTSSQCEKSTMHDSLTYCLVEGVVHAQQWGPACSVPSTGPLQCELMACLDLHFIRLRKALLSQLLTQSQSTRVNVKQDARQLSVLHSYLLPSVLPPPLSSLIPPFLSPTLLPLSSFLPSLLFYYLSILFLPLSFPLACSNIQFSFLSFTCSNIVSWMWNSADEDPCLLSQIVTSSSIWALELLLTLSSWNII